jgi:Zn finger protein HypA/HybF involved in hydrogenase expression
LALNEKSNCARNSIKRRLIETKTIVNECSECHLSPIWNGEPLVLILDHVNGINDDNRQENLRLLCPNCNSQQLTFCRGGKKRRPPVSRTMLIEALLKTSTTKEALLEAGLNLTANSYARITRLKEKVVV